MTTLPLSIEAARASDDPAIEKLHQRAFGPGRFARTAYRVREQAGPDTGFGFVARVGSLLVGSVQLTPVDIGPARALILGPLTVEPAFEGRGIGAALLQKSAEVARAEGYSAVLLVGDEAYYRRHGYQRVPPGRIELPGPVDPGRLLILPLLAEAELPRGLVRALSVRSAGS
jgi:predicted N-acetyltransferase YhbS